MVDDKNRLKSISEDHKQNIDLIDEVRLFEKVSEIIENRKYKMMASVNSEATMMFWEIGHFINSIILENKRAEYGKKILPTLSAKLVKKYGNSFMYRNLYCMILFSERFADYGIVASLSPQLSWSHIIELLPLKTNEARLYYASLIIEQRLTIRKLRNLISRKAYERREIANAQLTETSNVPFIVFKDPYLFYIFDLKDNYLEADLEKAILSELQKLILEFGRGFVFVDSQKRMSIDGDDVVLDLLFFNRILKRLVAVELKIGNFKAAFKGQMELYLAWLNEFERQDDEDAPIGIILCTSVNRKKVNLKKLLTSKPCLKIVAHMDKLKQEKRIKFDKSSFVEKEKGRGL